MRDLLELRDEIDVIDRQIVELFERRMAVSEEVAEYKISTGKKVFDKERERSKIETLTAMAHNDFNRHGIEELFSQIMSMSRKSSTSCWPGTEWQAACPLLRWMRLRKTMCGWCFRAWRGPTAMLPCAGILANR